MASKDEVVAETAQANRINLIMAVIVILSLVGSMGFSFIGITRPMMRLNGALGAMAGGNLDVVIPGASRGDEIGDLAKTVTVIRENAEQKARDEAEAKAIRTRSRQQRKADMIKLAAEFEGAVGEIVQAVSSASTQLESSAGTLSATAALAKADHRGGRGVRRGLHQCAVGGVGDRGAVVFGPTLRQRSSPFADFRNSSVFQALFYRPRSLTFVVARPKPCYFWGPTWGPKGKYGA